LHFAGVQTIKIQFSSWEKNVSLKRHVHRLVHSHPEGITLAVDEVNARRVNKITKQTLINKLNPDSEVDHLNIVDLESIGDRIPNANFSLAEHFAERANAIVVSMPTVTEGDMVLLDDFMKIAIEIGDISIRFQQAYADGLITEAEFDVIEKEIDEAIAALVRFKESVKLRVQLRVVK
jgi:hypothetical protein